MNKNNKNSIYCNSGNMNPLVSGCFFTCRLEMLPPQTSMTIDHMVHVCLRLPGSHWAKRQGRLRETNKAVLILLIVRNVLIETRKKLIHMMLNQSHAACTEFRRTLVEQLFCPLTNGCRDSVSSSPLHNHHRTMLVHSNRPCLNLSNAISVHCHFKQMCHLWLFVVLIIRFGQGFDKKHSRKNYRSPRMN